MNSEKEVAEDIFSQQVKRRKPGIIYLSTIPPSMNVTTLRAYYFKFGQIGRVYLQPKKGKKKRKSYSEGWIEFKSKRKAKYVQELLNNQPVGGKKRNPDYDILWNIKYLPRFKWEYLTQRLEYERQTFKMRLGAEISQVNKETDQYLKATMAKEANKKKKNKNTESENGFEELSLMFTQKLTEAEILKKKLTKKQKDAVYKKSLEKKKSKKLKLKNNKLENDDLVDSIFVGNNS